MLLLSLGADYFAGLEAFRGYYYSYVFALGLLVLFSFKVSASLFKPGEMLIALPTPAFMSQSSNIYKMRSIKQRIVAAQPLASIAPAAPSISVAAGRAAPKAPPTAPSFERRRYERVAGPSNLLDSLKGLFKRKGAPEEAVAAEGKPARKGLAQAPKPRALSVEEEAAIFAEELVPKRAAKQAAQQEPRWKRRMAERKAGEAGGESEEMAAFLGAVQKSYAEKHAESPFRHRFAGREEKAEKKDEAKAELNLLMQDVYSQLKDSRSAGLASSLAVKHEAAGREENPASRAGRRRPSLRRSWR